MKVTAEILDSVITAHGEYMRTHSKTLCEVEGCVPCDISRTLCMSTSADAIVQAAILHAMHSGTNQELASLTVSSVGWGLIVGTKIGLKLAEGATFESLMEMAMRGTE